MRKTNLNGLEALRFLVGLSCLLCFASAHAGDIVKDDSSIKIDWPSLKKDLHTAWLKREVKRVEILHLSTNAMTRIPVSSSALNQSHDFKLSIRYPMTSVAAAEIRKAVDKVSTKPLNKITDLRWAFIFYSTNDIPDLWVGFDKTGLEGVINGGCVKFDSDILKKCADENFSRTFADKIE